MKLCITSSGTGIGKTLVTASLCHQLRQRGDAAAAFKPVISGFSYDDKESDLHILLQSLGLETNRKNIDDVSLCRFKEPLSPHIAAEREGRSVGFAELSEACRKKMRDEKGYLFIEGAGGAMSPITRDKTFLDLMVELEVPALLVVGSYLGAISHALTAFEALKNRTKVHAIIVSESQQNPMPPEETAGTIQEFTKTKTVVLPRIHNIDYKWKHSFPILEKLGI